MVKAINQSIKNNQSINPAALNLQRIYAHVSNRMINERPLFIMNSELIQLPQMEMDFVKFIEDFHANRYNDDNKRYGDFNEHLYVADVCRQYHVIVDIRHPQRQQAFLDVLHSTPLKTPHRFHYAMANYVS